VPHTHSLPRAGLTGVAPQVHHLLRHAQRHMGPPDITQAPAILQAEALVQNVRQRMADDSHYTDNTKHLYPSSSLETAAYNPGAYL
jgi:hypothetical protein